jgi:hypothetical protein
MKANIAVATISGRAYYLIVSELRRKNVPFISLMPREPVPIGIRVVITTDKEKQLINHEKTLVYKDGADPEALVNNAIQIIQGKEYAERLVIGIDPGEVLGLAVLADGKVVQTENCSSVRETLKKIESILKNLDNTPAASISVKIGDGAPTYKEELLTALDDALPQNVVLESVSEIGTSHSINGTKHRRGLRDIVSATMIAGRKGHIFHRRKMNEQNR